MVDQVSTRRAMLMGSGASVAAALQSGVADAAVQPAGSAGTGRQVTRLAGRVALVTGATSGMGAVTARALAAAGAKVVFCGRRTDEGHEVEKSIRDAGGEALFVQADVTHEEQVKALLETVASRHGRLDYAFNNVGTSGDQGALHQLSTENFELVMQTNLLGNFLQMKYEIPLMIASGGGSIVGNSSIAGLRYIAKRPHYSAAKHGVIAMYCSAAIEYAKQKVRINVICPGFIKTEKAMRVMGGNEHIFDDRIPMGHIGQSQDVADAVLWLFSEESRYVTGAVIPVDGGQSVL
ncbi:MAG: glucose 1-dehydrogenase [Steroidobacteraceae bacterium]|nr:glucose 1-dehydrogenase [Nevskiaceae bacterium]MCP5472480.1 glucose 1-dehydrogenase [Nevskiaceae bacterium]